MYSYVYQPVVRLDTGEIIYNELLTRFDSQDTESAINELEKSGEIVNFDINNIKYALKILYASPDLEVGVNISQQSLDSHMFKHLLKKAYAEMPSESNPLLRLTLEITEHFPIKKQGQMRDTAQFIKHYGIKLAADDFGEGHMDLNALSEIKPIFIKVRSRADNQTKLEAKDYADNNSCLLIIENISSETELITAKEMNAFGGQGFFLGRPESTPRT